MQINNLLFIQAKYCSKHNILACNMRNMHKIHAYKKKNYYACHMMQNLLFCAKLEL